MNGSLRRRVAPLLTAAVLLSAVVAGAADFPYLLSDPLHTLPDSVVQGTVLPGDREPIPRGGRNYSSVELSLAEAVDLALANNQKIRAAWADIKIQAGAVGEAYAAYFPVVNVTTGWTLDYLSYPSYTSETSGYTVQASARWRIFDFGGRPANRHAAEHLLVSALAQHDATIQNALAGVIQAYFNAATADSDVRAKTENERLARETLEVARGREASGAGSRSDTLRAATSLTRMSLDKNRAEGGYQGALGVLKRIVGLRGDTEIKLPQELGTLDGGGIRELRLWLEEAGKGHPSIVAARNLLDAALQQVAAARSAGLPAVDITGNYYKNNRPGETITRQGTEETTMIISLTIPIFDGFASTYKLRGAQAQVEKRSAALADTEQEVAFGVIRAYASAVSSLRNLEISVALLEIAREALEASQVKYEKGAADITDVLSTQAALADARNERVRCLAEWQSARLQLLASAGRMGRSAVSGREAE